jgi:hypothetical protein
VGTTKSVYRRVVWQISELNVLKNTEGGGEGG